MSALATQSVSHPSPFYESSVFIKLKKRFNECIQSKKPCEEPRAILIRGPKGCGKTASMTKLYSDLSRKNSTCYIDLTSSKIQALQILDKQTDIDVHVDCDILFLDNAQNWKELAGFLKIHDVKYLLAAFSPGVGSGYTRLGKCVGDDSYETFLFGPLDVKETREFLGLLYNAEISDENNTALTSQSTSSTASGSHSISENIVSQSRFAEIFFFSCGAPRYIKEWYEGQGQSVEKEILNQHERCFEKHPEVKDSIFRLVCNCKSNGWKLLVCGLAFTRDRLSESCYLANPMHIRFALGKLSNDSTSLSWCRLETYVIAFLLCGQCTASDGEEDIKLPHVSTCLVQKEVGEVPSIMLSAVGASVLRLVENHPVIDSIVFDSTTKLMYVVQTLTFKYANHEKKISDLSSDNFGLSTNINVPQHLKTVKILDHYNSHFKAVKCYFVYATCNPRRPRDGNVYVFDLCKKLLGVDLNPET